MLMVSPVIVEASVVDSGSTYNYNGTDWPIAYDQTNNQYWLALSATQGLSVSDVVSSTLIPGWSFAVQSDIYGFFDSISAGLGTSVVANAVHDELVSLWAFWPGINDNNYPFYRGWVGNDPTSPTTRGAMWYYNSIVSGVPPIAGLSWTGVDYTGDVGSITSTNSSHGVFLVSSSIPTPPQTSTPLPHTAALFTVGIAFMEWRRRRKPAHPTTST